MVQITVSDDLARAIVAAGSPVTLVDSSGRPLGDITPIGKSEFPLGMTGERLSEINRRMQEPGNYVPYQTIKERLGW
jgi:hypothetical protein